MPIGCCGDTQVTQTASRAWAWEWSPSWLKKEAELARIRKEEEEASVGASLGMVRAAGWVLGQECDGTMTEFRAQSGFLGRWLVPALGLGSGKGENAQVREIGIGQCAGSAW